jgi:hypothetical protein
MMSDEYDGGPLLSFIIHPSALIIKRGRSISGAASSVQD